MKYTIQERIGKGGFGVVDRALSENNELFAIKSFVDPEIPEVNRDSLLKRFAREVAYQRRFDHPNIVKIVDVNLDTDPPFFVMELADGNLHQELRKDHTLNGDPSNVLFDVLSGLEAIHSIGITHRDLKPANVLRFELPDGTRRYAISDFGLMSASESQSTTLTQSNIGGGTEAYAAPECAVNLKKATFLSDIYSFGAMLHDIFVGTPRVPYTQLTGPEPIRSIIEKATQKLPIRRYQSVQELRDDLFEALNQKDLVFSSNEEEAIVVFLQSDDNLNDEEWDRLFLYVEDCEEQGISLSNVFRYVSLERIEELSGSPELLTALGRSYCRHVYEGTFGFDYCDVLASRTNRFFSLGGVEIKALALLGLLELGTSHNRWYVERLFMSLAGTDLSDEVAERVVLEVEVQGISQDFRSSINHIEASIGTSRTKLHQRLQDIS